MSIVAVVVLVSLAVAALAVGGSAALRRRSRPTHLLPAALRAVSATLTLVIAAWLGPSAWQDSGAAGLGLLGLPVWCGLAAAATDLLRRGRAVVTTVAAVVTMSWSLFLGLGPVLSFVLPALVMVAAAAASWTHAWSEAARAERRVPSAASGPRRA